MNRHSARIRVKAGLLLLAPVVLLSLWSFVDARQGSFGLGVAHVEASSTDIPPSSTTEPPDTTPEPPTVTPEPPGPNCSFTQGFWKNHPEDWPVETLTVGGVTYTQAEALAIFGTPTRGDATYILIHQLMAATLNVANGADGAVISDTIVDANSWLSANPLGSRPRNPERSVGIGLARTLDDYNNGDIGPGHCD